MRRFSLCPILVLLALFALAPRARAQSTAASPDWHALENEAVQKLSAYVRVDTTNPPGNEIRAAQWYARILQAEGIPYQIAESAPG
ncbi:MAG: hypothetical protein WA855_08025, partial [Candidatus Acidiferrales bacterium]